MVDQCSAFVPDTSFRAWMRDPDARLRPLARIELPRATNGYQ